MGELINHIVNIRTHHPEVITRQLANRERGTLPDNGKLMIIACDHPARGALAAGANPMAMASREEVLSRCVKALSRPGVNGFLGTADMIEDLTLLGSLEGKLVYGSMNRGGLAGTSFEMDDRRTGYDAKGIVDAGLDGGKMLFRVNYSDAGTVSTMESCAQAIDELASQHVMAMVEPFISRWENGAIINDLSPEAVMVSMAISAGLGRTSAYTWLKLPAVENIEQVMEATTLPALILGGGINDPASAHGLWRRALALPGVRGLVVGRSLLFPPDGDVARAVDEAVGLL